MMDFKGSPVRIVFVCLYICQVYFDYGGYGFDGLGEWEILSIFVVR